MKKPTAAMSTVYAPILLSRWPPNAAMHDQSRQPARWRHGRVERVLRAMAGWQTNKGFFRDGFEARDRQQELFVMVDAAVAGAASQQHRLRRSVHPALYRRRRQAADFELYAFRQGAGADRRRRHDLGFACHYRIRRRTFPGNTAVARGPRWPRACSFD